MRVNKLISGFWIFLPLLLLIQRGGAQSFDTKGEKHPYYINLNEAGTEVYDVHDGLLSIQYEDRYGKSADLLLTVYNWKREVVGKYMLKKQYGLNYFNIQLSDGGTVASGETYRCLVSDENGNKYEIFFKLLPPPDKSAPVVNIIVNPISFKCGDPLRNVVEFYGDIKNGKAPYKVDWYVMNSARTEFLYQPRNEAIERPGHTTVVRVEKNPEYYVMLHVKDACGQEARQMVLLTCTEKKRKIHTVFVEPLRKLPGTTKIIQ